MVRERPRFYSSIGNAASLIRPSLNAAAERVKWMAIDGDYGKGLEDPLKLQVELDYTGIQAALEQSRRGGHVWIFFDSPVPAKHARVYIGDLPKQSLVDVKAPGAGDGIELFPKQDPVEEGQFGNAIRAPLGIDRGAIRGYWFYGAPYELEAQMIYLRTLRRVTGQQLRALTATMPVDSPRCIHAGWNSRRSECAS